MMTRSQILLLVGSLFFVGSTGACSKDKSKDADNAKEETAKADTKAEANNEGKEGTEPEEKPAKSEEEPVDLQGEKQYAALVTGSSEPTGIDLKIADQDAYLALPKTRVAPKGGVVLVHGYSGLRKQTKLWADRFAADGFPTVTVDLYEGAHPNGHEESLAMMLERLPTTPHITKTLKAAVEFMKTDSRVQASKIAMVGQAGSGSNWSLLFSRENPVDAMALFTPGPDAVPADQLNNIGGPVLMFFGDKDHVTNVATQDAFVAELKKNGADLEVIRFTDTDFDFHSPDGPTYKEESAADAHKRTLDFLKAKLAGE